MKKKYEKGWEQIFQNKKQKEKRKEHFYFYFFLFYFFFSFFYFFYVRFFRKGWIWNTFNAIQSDSLPVVLMLEKIGIMKIIELPFFNCLSFFFFFFMKISFLNKLIFFLISTIEKLIIFQKKTFFLRTFSSSIFLLRKREEAMCSRVKNLEKITKELLSQILLWEEVRGPFMFAVRTCNTIKLCVTILK